MSFSLFSAMNEWQCILFLKRELRAVPTIVIAHTFCASPDTRISCRQCLLIQGYFCAFQNYPEKLDLRKYSWSPKRQLRVTMHFLEIIKLQFEKERHTLLCILKLFKDIIDELSLKNAWLPQFYFWISIGLVKIYISCILTHRRKNIFN